MVWWLTIQSLATTVNGSGAPEERGDGVPGVAAQLARRAVVAGHDQTSGFSARICGISRRAVSIISTFVGEVAVLAGAVGVLVVDEEEVVVVPHALRAVSIWSSRVCAGVEHVHADQAGQALVHRVDGDGGGSAQRHRWFGEAGEDQGLWLAHAG